MKTKIREYLSDTHGSTAIVFALVSLLLIGSGAIAVDYTQLYRHKAELQQLVDASALAGVNEMMVANRTDNQIKSLSKSFVLSGLQLAPSNKIVLDVETLRSTSDGNSVTVSAKLIWQPFFAQFLNKSVTPIQVKARAISAGGDNICVIGLNDMDSGTLSLTSNAKIIANGCAVYSNSKSTDGFFAYSGSLVQSSQNCTSGGYKGPVSNFVPTPITDCPITPDPLASRAAPDTTGCDYNYHNVHRQITTLRPGVYCGGLSIGTGSTVTLSPGVYVIKDGRLEVTSNSKLLGKGAGFYFTGENSTFLFTSNAQIDLEAPTNGPLAGILFFEDRNAAPGHVFEILGEKTRNLVGTVYLPKGTLFVSSPQPVADQSAYTAVIANKVIIGHHAKLVLNTNYDMTTVPVPAGLQGVSGSRLIQ